MAGGSRLLWILGGLPFSDGCTGVGGGRFRFHHAASRGRPRSRWMWSKRPFMGTRLPIPIAGWKMRTVRIRRLMCGTRWLTPAACSIRCRGATASTQRLTAAAFDWHDRHAAGRRALLLLYPPRGHAEPAGAAGARRPAWKRPDAGRRQSDVRRRHGRAGLVVPFGRRQVRGLRHFGQRLGEQHPVRDRDCHRQTAARPDRASPHRAGRVEERQLRFLITDAIPRKAMCPRATTSTICTFSITRSGPIRARTR